MWTQTVYLGPGAREMSSSSYPGNGNVQALAAPGGRPPTPTQRGHSVQPSATEAGPGTLGPGLVRLEPTVPGSVAAGATGPLVRMALICFHILLHLPVCGAPTGLLPVRLLRASFLLVRKGRHGCLFSSLEVLKE